MATFVKTNSRPTNGGNVNKNIKQKDEGRRLTLQGRKEKKYPFDDDADVQGIFEELMVAKSFLSQNQSNLLKSTGQMILSIVHITGSSVIP